MKPVQSLIVVTTILTTPVLFAVPPGAVPPGMGMPAPDPAARMSGGPPGTPIAAGNSMPGVGPGTSPDRSPTYPGGAPPLKEQLAQSPQELLSLPLGPGGTPSTPQPPPPGFQPISPGGEGSFPSATISAQSPAIPSRADRILHETELRVTLRHYEKTLTEISELGLKVLQQKEQVRSGEQPAQSPETTTLEAKLKVLQNWRLQIEDRIRKLQDQSRQSGSAEQQVTIGEAERVRLRQAEAKLAQLTKGHAEGFVSDQELTEAKFLVELCAAELKGDPIALAEYRVRHAEHTLEVATKLYETKAGSKESFDEAKSNLELRKAELKRSKDAAAQARQSGSASHGMAAGMHVPQTGFEPVSWRPAPPAGAIFTAEKRIAAPAGSRISVELSHLGELLTVKAPLGKKLTFKTSLSLGSGVLLRWQGYGADHATHANRWFLDLVDTHTGALFYRFEDGFTEPVKMSPIEEAVPGQDTPATLERAGSSVWVPLLRAEPINSVAGQHPPRSEAQVCANLRVEKSERDAAQSGAPLGTSPGADSNIATQTFAVGQMMPESMKVEVERAFGKQPWFRGCSLSPDGHTISVTAEELRMSEVELFILKKLGLPMPGSPSVLGPSGAPGDPSVVSGQTAIQPPPGGPGIPGGAPTESRDSLRAMPGIGGQVTAEEASAHGFPFPRGEAVVGKYESALFVHDGKDVHYIVFHVGDFGVTDASTHNPKTSDWKDERKITLKNGRSFGFTRTSRDNLHVLVNGTEYDLRAGRAFSLSDDGKIEQLRAQPSMELMRETQQRIRSATLPPAAAKSPKS